MKQKIKFTDFIMASTIFVLAILEFISWIQSHGREAVILDPGDGYLLYDYPRNSTIGYLIVAIFFVAKTFMFKTCIYTKIITWVYLTIQLINTSAIIFKYGSGIYNELVYPIFLCTIFSLIFVKILRWVFQKQ